MKKIVNGCLNCPFCHTEYDYDTIGKPDTDVCVLSNYLKLNNPYIDLNENEYKPKWCPLINDDYTFKFKEFSDKTKNEILTLNKKISENEYQYGQDYENDEFDYIANNIENKELYKKLDELMNNDELSDYNEDIKEEFNNSIDQVKNQLKNLEALGTKLNDELNNLGNIH